METFLHLTAIILGLFGLVLYFVSIVRVLLLNRRERDFVERFARFSAVSIMHSIARHRRNPETVQRLQAWIMPIFIFFAVASWFLIVQLSFSFILWGLHTEPQWPRAFSSSGSALSTLGFLTPKTLLGEYLAVYESAVGLVIVVLLFTFVPGYLGAIQVRERKVGWLYARTGDPATCVGLLESLHRSERLQEADVWEDWEAWFRGLVETHAVSPILAYVPAIYAGRTWVSTAATVLDAASIMLSCIQTRNTENVRICRETGVMALRLIATEVHRDLPQDAWDKQRADNESRAAFPALDQHLSDMGLPLKGDADARENLFVSLRADYADLLAQISHSTLMPLTTPWNPLSPRQPAPAA